MNNPLRTIACVGLAAGAIYYFDPLLGKRRRSLLRDQWVRASTRSARAARVVGRDSSNRMHGWLAQLRSGFTSRYHDDEALIASIRAKLGRLVSHPSAIDVAAHDGNVVLSGPILASEVDRLLDGIRAMPEARGVESQLEAHQEPGNVSALQGGRRRRHAEFWESQYWSPMSKAVACVSAAALTVTGLAFLGPRRSFPFAIGAAVALQTAKLWSDERRESIERKANRWAPFDAEAQNDERRQPGFPDDEAFSRRRTGVSSAAMPQAIIPDL